MNTFLQLVLVQLITAVLITALLLFNQVSSTQQELASQEAQGRLVVQQLLHDHFETDGKVLSRQIRQSLNPHQLQITLMDSTELYNHRSSSSAPGMATTLLQWLGYQHPIHTLQNNELQLQVRYQLNHDATISQLQSRLWFVLFIPLLICFLASAALLWWFQYQLRAVSKKMSALLDTIATNPAQSLDTIELPKTFEDTGVSLQNFARVNQKKLTEMTANARQVTEDAYKDPVTELPNRNRFVQYYEEQLSKGGQVDFGIFAITRCTELQNLNQTRGYQEGDKYIKEVCEVLKKTVHTYPGGQLYRLNSSDFGILLPRVTPKEAENFAVQLQSRLNEYQKIAELDSVAYTGLVSYESGRALGELLAIADTSISLAQTKQTNAWHLQKESAGLETASYGYGNQNWRNVIDDVLANNRIALLYQSIQPSSRSAKAYSEILVRFKTQENQVLPTASFLAMAEKLDRIIPIDRLIIETALSTIKSKNLQDQYFGLNLSSRCIHDDQFIIWLERRLLKDATIAAKLIFEVTEFGLQQNLKTSKRFIDMVHRAGARITVEKFGVGITSFKFFRELKPDYIKMDGSYTRRIDDDKNNQYFLRLMIDLAHRIGVGVFAESVETQEEKHMLDSLFIDGCQGYYIGKPTSL
ncbi:EAL domain-containing protein [Alkalimonas collagenimarina]|uniref:EAL domain-containing protein n=1 Tax=Alkalimonas collagenimarina TaxID=400390 RepID=A0ABT9H338_9GAMM|nr:EAL domain-containing protein [Alkalimonas collagenimarina]MDP4537736.1 EAL domain-containing protein [Alkalimonas collagenimarina]